MAKQPSKAAPAAPKSSVPATQDSGPLVVQAETMPDYIKKGEARGSENVKTDDLTIPRLEIIQAISPQMDEKSGEYIPGAKPGQFTNSVTNQLYGSEVMLVPVHYSKQYLVWTDRDKGGGFHGAYPTPKEALDRANQEGGEKAGVKVIDTPTHLCLLVNQHAGAVDEVIVSMPRTKAKVSRQWNSMIRMAGGDRFSRVYRMTSQQEENKKGKFHNFVIAQSGYPAKALYEKAEKLYNQIAGGERNIVMDTKGFNPGAEGDPENTEM